MKRILAALAALALSACSGNAPHTPAQRTRIVSLMPSLTEDLCAIGAGPQVVGVSAYSADIPCARNLPAVGNASSIDAERILRLHANVVAAIPAQRLLVAPVRRAGIATAFFADDTYGDIFSDISGLGALSGRERQARDLIVSLKGRTRSLMRSEHFARRPTVFVVVQAQPIWTVGPQSYISTLLFLAGARNAVASLPQAYSQYGAEALVRLQPDAIVATNDSGLRGALGREPWRSLRAVQQRHVFFPDGDSVVVRPGPNYNEGLAWLIDRLRPLAK